MLERFNYFDKLKLLRRDIQIRLGSARPDGRPVMIALTIADLELPGHAMVFVEAYRQMEFERVRLGTVLECAEPREAVFVELPDLDGVRFRIRIVDTASHVVLAEAEGLTADAGSDGEQQDSILPVRAADIGDRVWKMELDDPPTILISERWPDWREVARRAEFRSLVFPQACESALLWAVEQVEPDNPPDPNSAVGQWLRFGQLMTGTPCPDDEAEQAQWIDDAVSALARREGSFAKFDVALREDN